MADTGNDPLAPETPVSAETAHGDGTDSVVSARDRFQRLTKDFSSQYRRVSGDVRRGAERAKAEIRQGAERAKTSYEGAGEKARLGYERLRTDAGNLTHEVTAYVRENPARSVMIAAGVGFLLGMLARRGRGEDDE